MGFSAYQTSDEKTRTLHFSAENFLQPKELSIGALMEDIEHVVLGKPDSDINKTPLLIAISAVAAYQGSNAAEKHNAQQKDFQQTNSSPIMC